MGRAYTKSGNLVFSKRSPNGNRFDIPIELADFFRVKNVVLSLIRLWKETLHLLAFMGHRLLRGGGNIFQRAKLVVNQADVRTRDGTGSARNDVVKFPCGVRILEYANGEGMLKIGSVSEIKVRHVVDGMGKMVKNTLNKRFTHIFGFSPLYKNFVVELRRNKHLYCFNGVVSSD